MNKCKSKVKVTLLIAIFNMRDIVYWEFLLKGSYIQQVCLQSNTTVFPHSMCQERWGLGTTTCVCFILTMHLLSMPCLSIRQLLVEKNITVLQNPLSHPAWRVFLYPNLKEVIIKGTCFEELDDIMMVLIKVWRMPEEPFQKCTRLWLRRPGKCIEEEKLVVGSFDLN